MNAHALLTSQGWRGTGNSLHPTSNSIGLSKPLLVSRKDDNHGIGKKHSTSDMWWMNAFDKTLKGLDTTSEGKVIQTVTNGGLDVVKRGGGKWVLNKGGLYANFVKGEGLAGSLKILDTAENRESKKKRKREASESETKTDKKARKEASTKHTPKDKVKRKESIKVGKVLEDGKLEDSLPKIEFQTAELVETEVHSETAGEKLERRRLKKILRKQALSGEADTSCKSKKKKKKRL